MKKITFTIFALLLGSIGYIKAQAVDTIPNGDFERWQHSKNLTYSIPQGWDSISGISDSVSAVEYEKDNQLIVRPVYDGKQALSLACSTGGGLIHFGAIECKFPMIHRDPYINMNIAYMEGNAPETPEFVLIVWNSKTHDTLTKGVAYLPVGNPQNPWANDTMEPWSPFPLTIGYDYTSKQTGTADTTIPDSAIIYIQNAIGLAVNGVPVNPTASVLYIEKMWFANSPNADIEPGTISNNGISIYPNPFTNKTTIHYNLSQSGEVNLTVYDMQGREIKTLVNGNQPQGTYNEVFDGSGLSNGVYLYKLQTSSGVQTGKLILSK